MSRTSGLTPIYIYMYLYKYIYINKTHRTVLGFQFPAVNVWMVGTRPSNGRASSGDWMQSAARGKSVSSACLAISSPRVNPIYLFM